MADLTTALIALWQKCGIVSNTIHRHNTARIGFFKVFYPHIANIFQLKGFCRLYFARANNVKKPLKALFLGTLGLYMGGTAWATGGQVRDTELENTLRAYAYPIIDVTSVKRKDVRLYIIADESINAAVFGQKRMLVHTGLFLQSDTPEEIFSIIAHEMAHMASNHVAQKQGAILANQSTHTLTQLAGATAAILSGDAGNLIGSLALGQHIAIRQHLQYSRSKEKVADIKAIEYLQKAKISPKGVIKILGKIKAEYGDAPNPYLLSHPTPANRIELAERAMQDSPYAHQDVHTDYQVLLDRAKAKIIGNIYPMDRILQHYPKSDNSLYALYARASGRMLSGDYKMAHLLIDQLLQKSPNDPFFIETKGDIYRHQNKPKQAIDTYERALKIIPWAGLIRNNVATILLAKSQSDDVNQTQKEILAKQALDHLKIAHRTEQYNPRVLKNLASAYSILGNRGLSSWASAERYFVIGDFDLATRHAKLADKIIKTMTPEKIRIQDILASLEIMNQARP